MHKHYWIFAVAAIALGGCGDNNNGNGSHDMAMNGGGGDDGGVTDMTPPSDLVDTTPAPAPTATKVGATGPSAGLVALGDKMAAYLLNPTGSPATGALHVVTSDGTD